MCRLAEIRENLMPIIEERVRTRSFNAQEYYIFYPENDERLFLLLQEDNHRNKLIMVIHFENIQLEISGKRIPLAFQIRLKLGENNHINVWDLALINIPTAFLQDHDESEISKQIISCWNA